MFTLGFSIKQAANLHLACFQVPYSIFHTNIITSFLCLLKHVFPLCASEWLFLKLILTAGSDYLTHNVMDFTCAEWAEGLWCFLALECERFSICAILFWIMTRPCVFLTSATLLMVFFLCVSCRMKRSVTSVWVAMLGLTASLSSWSANRSRRVFVSTSYV